MAAAKRRARIAAQSTSAARITLRVFMEWWSEGNWAAGWISDVEHYMKRDLRGSERQAFKWLIEQAGGWWGGDTYPPPFIEGTFDDLEPAAAPRTRDVLS